MIVHCLNVLENKVLNEIIYYQQNKHKHWLYFTIYRYIYINNNTCLDFSDLNIDDSIKLFHKVRKNIDLSNKLIHNNFFLFYKKLLVKNFVNFNDYDENFRADLKFIKLSIVLKNNPHISLNLNNKLTFDAVKYINHYVRSTHNFLLTSNVYNKNIKIVKYIRSCDSQFGNYVKHLHEIKDYRFLKIFIMYKDITWGYFQLLPLDRVSAEILILLLMNFSIKLRNIVGLPYKVLIFLSKHNRFIFPHSEEFKVISNKYTKIYRQVNTKYESDICANKYPLNSELCKFLIANDDHRKFTELIDNLAIFYNQNLFNYIFFYKFSFSGKYLLRAIEFDNFKMVEGLLKFDIDINTKNQAFLSAIKLKNIKMIEIIFKLGITNSAEAINSLKDQNLKNFVNKLILQRNTN